MKDLFGNELNVKSTKKKIHVAKKQDKPKEEINSKEIGLNAIYKDFGNYIVNNRGNKTP